MRRRDGETDTGAARLTIRRIAGEAYPRWVRAGAAVGLIGYAISSTATIVQEGRAAFPDILSEVLAATVIGLAYAFSLRQPARAAAAVLVAVCAELMFGFYMADRVYANGMLVTPLLVVAAGIMLGEVAAFFVAFAASALAPALISFGLAKHAVPGILAQGAERYYIIHAVALFGTWVLVTAGLRAFTRAFATSQASERRAADTVRMAPDGIVVVDANGQVDGINPAAERILGVSAEQWLHRSVGALLEAAGADEDALRVLRPGRASVLPLAVALKQAGRGAIHVELTSQVMQSGGEQWMLRDVSERVREEGTRRSMELHLAHVQRMEAVGQLAGGIAHDFNNLLTAIGASAEMLRDETAKDADRTLIDEIIAAQERGRTLTRQLLSFARRDLAQPRVFDLAAQVREMERLVVRVAGERVRFSFAFDANCRVRADVGQVEQALVNLVSNARDAMPEGGACRISVKRESRADGSCWVALSVSDTGVGMDETTRRHAFEPFFTTKPRGKGTGLGLASVHGIVAANGGRSVIESVPGLGTTVTLEFPAVDAPLDVVMPPDEGGSRPRTEGSVLVAEDDAAIRSAVSRILTRAGYEVVVACDGLEAAHLAEKRDAPFDLVLTDVIMPSATGPQLVARLRRRWPHQVALFMSGYPEDALADVPNFSVERDFLAKPFKPAELERRVAEALTGARTSAVL